jgi:hypothetical protein
MEQEPTAAQSTAAQIEIGPEYAPGIRGWLAWFSVGVWVMPLILAYYSIQGWLEFVHSFGKAAGRPFDLKMVGVILQRLPESWSAVIALGMVVAIVALYGGLLGVSIWLITQWWRRKRQFPRNWIILQVAFLVIAVIVLVVAHDQQALQPRDAVASLANILFWWKSKRVTATFTQ